MNRIKKTDRQEKPHIHEYTLPGGWVVLAGRTDSDNDLLSFKVAGQNDWWFHVKGMPGSHVILQARPNPSMGATPDAVPDRDTLKRAAAVAAYHSKARAGGMVAVSGTQARHVTKPRGAKPGTVNIRKEVVFKVRPGLPTI
jgi:predicted ribosome quality control (RQC) complex YloA/Tae2 family protein